MSLAIQRSSEFSPASVGFSKLRKNKNGGKTVYLNGGDNKKLYLQLPFMRSPYGLSAFTDEGTGRTTYSLDLSFDTDNAEAMELHDKLKELDEIIVNRVSACGAKMEKFDLFARGTLVVEAGKLSFTSANQTLDC